MGHRIHQGNKDRIFIAAVLPVAVLRLKLAFRACRLDGYQECGVLVRVLFATGTVGLHLCLL